MTKDIQNFISDGLTSDERTMQVLHNVDNMLLKFAEQEHIKEAIKTNSITPKMIDPRLTEKLINSLRWVTSNLELKTVDRFINQGDFENGDVIKQLLRESTFNVRMYN